MTTSPIYHGGERLNQPNRLLSCPPPSTFYLSCCTLDELHQTHREFITPSHLPHEGATTSSPMAYDYPSQTSEILQKHYPSNSAACNHSAWTTTATISPTFSQSKPTALVTGGSTPDCGSTVLTSVSTPSIGFDNYTPASALSFPSPTQFSEDLSSIQQFHSASDLACYGNPVTPALQRPLLSSSSSDDCTNYWPHHSLSINSLAAAHLNSSSSFLSLSDPVPSDSSSRSWTPDQAESLNPPSAPPELDRTPYQLSSIGSLTTTEKLATLLPSHLGETPPASNSKFNSSPFLAPEPLIINPHDASGVIRSSLTPQLSPFCEDVHYLMPNLTFSPHSTNFNLHASEPAPQSCPPLTSLTRNSTEPALMYATSSSFAIPSTWHQPNHFSYLDSPRCHSQYDCHSDPQKLSSLRNYPTFRDSVNQPPNALSSQLPSQNASPENCLTPPISASLIEDEQYHISNSLPDSYGRVPTQPTSKRNVQHENKFHAKKKRDFRELEATCGVCGDRMARLTLRGSPEELYVADGFELVHTCELCQEGRPRGGPPLESPASTFAPFSGRSFVSNPKCQQFEMCSPSAPQSTMPTFRKRNRRTDDVTAPTTCDCCARQLGVGGIVPRNGRSAIQFVVEVVCVYCINNFRRCTDCGGGGGARLGVGKWRCKELFSEGRKTCILSHQRQGPSTEVVTSVWKVRDLLDKPELETLVSQLRELVKHSLYAALATPEMLESGLARIKCFDDIETMYINGWKRLEPLIREDAECSSCRRRYVGLRWTKPHPRKGPKRIPHDFSPITTLPGATNIVLQPGKELSGFVMSEWDMQRGTFFISVAMPWQSGDALESTTELANKTFIQAKLDRQRLIDEMVHQGMNRRDALLRYPPIRHLWTFLFFHRDARLVQFLQKKRKFIPLDEYLAQYPDARRDFFPPQRDCYVPTHEQQGWNVWVRRENGNTVSNQSKS